MKHTHKKKTRRGAVICGAYGRGNAGDDAILRAILQEMRQLDETMPVRVISRNPAETSQRFGVTACHTFHFRKIWQAVGKAELFVSGGGSLIQNATSSRSLYYYLMTLLMAKLRGCKVMMYGSGIGPVYGRFHRWAAGKIIDHCVDVATLRDEDSRRELGQMGVKTPKILCTADPTISIHKLHTEQGAKLLEYLGIPADGMYLGLGLRLWKDFGEAVESMAEALEYAWKTYGLIPVFVPIEYPSDCQAAKKVIEKLNCPYYLISEQLEISETVSVLAHMKAMIGMRLHSLIFAVENGVPSVGVSYDMKVDGFLKSIGCSDALLHIESVTARQLQKQIDRCMQAQERSKWQQAAQKLIDEEGKNLHEVRELLYGACTHQSNQASEGQKTMRQQKKRIAIFQSDLHVGGIQKSLVNLMSLEAMDRYDVDVYLFDRDVFFDLSDIRPHIQIHYLKAFPYYFRLVPFGAIMKLMPRFKFATTEPYDVAIDFSNYQQDCAFGALTVPAKKRVMWIHNDMEIKYREEKKYRILWTFFHSKFHRFSEFVAVSDGIIQPFKNKTGLKDAKVTAIPNLIDTHEIFEKCDKPIDFDVDPNKFNIASMGHLYHQKGYDIMLDQLKTVCETRKDLAIYIFGDGPAHQVLVEQAKRNGLENIVHFMGYQSNPYPYLNKMDAFYLESRYEGQGMVLWEAKALGLPLIFPKRLEKYNISLKGTENIQDTLLHIQRAPKTKDDLHEYNDEICRRLIRLIESD